jgi:hypothetical protein
MRNKITTKVLLGGLAIGVGAFLAQAAAPASPQGAITAKAFTGIGGTAISALTSHANFPDNPNVLRYEPYFEWAATGDINTAPPNWGDNYGVQIVGYFYPATSGPHTFYIASDDNGELYLSPDTNPENKRLIAREGGWSNARSYTTAGSDASAVADKNSSTFAGSQWPGGGTAITLTAGQPYYIEALMKEGTGGDNLSVSIDGVLPIPGSQLATIDKSSGPVVIVTQPQSQAVEVLQEVNFTVEVDGTPPYTYQWRRNGTPIEGATTASYTLDRAVATDHGAVFTVVVTGAEGAPVTSEGATLTVAEDANPPTIASVTGSAAFNAVTVTFSEPVDPTTAQATANYQLSGGVTITAVTQNPVPNDNQVVLSTSAQAEGAELTLTVNNVQDLSGNVIAAGSTFTFQTFVWLGGVVLHEFWDNIGGTAVSALVNDPRFPNAPSWVTLEPMFEFPPNGASTFADNYGNRISGWFIPPETTEYIFYVSADDSAELYLSTDADPANTHLIARQSGWSNPRNWNTQGGGTGTVQEKRSDQFPDSQWPDGPLNISLTAGQRYYIEVLHKEGTGGDNVGVTYGFDRDFANPPANGTPPALTGERIGTYVNMNGAALSITQQPQAVSVAQNNTATFSIAVTSTSAYGDNVHGYQWQSAPAGSTTFTNIAGATQPTYTTPMLSLTDDGRQFRVLLNLLTLSETSDVAVLTVGADTTPPTIVSAGALQGDNTVGVLFDKMVTEASAQTAANYQVSGATVTSVELHIGRLAQVNLSGPVPASFTVTVNNVTDLAGNPMLSTEITGEISTMNAQDVGVVGTNPLIPGHAFAFGGGGYFVAGGGTDIWDAADAFQFVYREFTGAFDMRANVMSLLGTHQWAKAALMARETLTPGSRHVDILGTRSANDPADPTATPPIQTPQNQINMQWRDVADAASGSHPDANRINIAQNADYPNLWLRLVRPDAASNEFRSYWSNNGTTWTQMPSHTVPDPILPATLYVGMAVTSHDNNAGIPLAEAVYNNFTVVPYVDVVDPVDPELQIALEAGNVVITWQAGTLVSSPTITGTFAPVPGATSPYQVTPTAGTMFYRVQQ